MRGKKDLDSGGVTLSSNTQRISYGASRDLSYSDKNKKTMRQLQEAALLKI